MSTPTSPAAGPGSPKQAIYANLAAIAQAIGHPNRIELLEQLAQGQRSVEALAEACGLTFANTSRHLQILRRARLVDTERQGKRVLYRLAGAGDVVSLLKALGAVGERNSAEIRQVMGDYFHARDALAPISREDLLVRLQDGDVTLIDVRPEHEFSLGHLPGALNIPVQDLAQRLRRLPKNRDIVAYCRGPFCVMAFDAVAALRAKGYRVRRLEDGFPEWMAAGLEVETGPAAGRSPRPTAKRKPPLRASTGRDQASARRQGRSG
ncbi:MAG TPA: metalloregulator ArsR/SmtB family transcription factor [Luteimonas sp.]|nr:metalloregulator ArsR/SmtB family transcription factor [Luteimonas sp.]HRO26428.1 metalloregulator ArsR/SmtB family transcription factor [Luteimonas sp.]HRP73087.1 metalloregulator ArsR/SmtB family transcription factor [Luteimonas sp.]